MPGVASLQEVGRQEVHAGLETCRGDALGSLGLACQHREREAETEIAGEDAHAKASVPSCARRIVAEGASTEARLGSQTGR